MLKLPTLAKKTLLSSLGLVAGTVLVSASLLQPLRASALSSSDFNAGRIIDNSVFTDANAMSVQDIQNFLNAKVGSCDNNGTGSAAPFNSGMTRAAYDASIGKNTQFTCINQYYENTTTLANNLDGNSIPSGAISAAQIIYNAAQQYQINPQVIITTLQKEQGLVTDTWPWDSEYTEAMGYGCPDTSPCSGNQGFYSQVTGAAWQFRRYLTYPNNYNYVVGSDYILWAPNTGATAGCGGSTVNIQNQATAALYDYTPYQPNAGALSGVSSSSPGGTATCGAYGNRNFWWYFNTWFGSSLAPNYSWTSEFYGLTDTATGDPAASSDLTPGEDYTATLAALNTGNSTWTNTGPSPVNLATAMPTGRNSILCDSSWSSCSRPTRLVESSVAPGSIGHFVFTFHAPYTPGTYYESFKPVAEELAWFNDDLPGETMGITVANPGTFSWNTTGYIIKDQSGTQMDPGRLQPGQHYTATLSATNTGTATWYNNGTMPVTLATADPDSGNSPLYNNTWLAPNRLAYLTESSVAPGQTGHFTFTFQAPYTPGSYRESFKPVAEFYSWFNDPQPNDTLGIWVTH